VLTLSSTIIVLLIALTRNGLKTTTTACYPCQSATCKRLTAKCATIYVIAEATAYVFSLCRKNVSDVVKGQGMEEPLVVVTKVKRLVLVQESDQVLREAKRQLLSYSLSADL
jgi:hypothetical protein